MARVGNTVTICVPEDEGIEKPYTVDFTTGTGNCEIVEVLEIWNIGNVGITLGEDLIICGNECLDLEVELEGEGTLENTTVSWTPTTGLSDPNSLETEVCDLTADVTYIVEVIFPGGCVKSDTIEIDHRPEPLAGTPEVVNFCFGYEDAILTATDGLVEYQWFQLLGGNDIQIGATAVNTFITNIGGTFKYKAFDGIDPCPVDLGEFTVVPQSCADWGDLPDSSNGTGPGNYETSPSNNGPSHLLVDGLYLGSSVDIEYIDQQSTIADGDDNGDTDDEDGILFPGTMQITPGGNLNIPLSVTNMTSDTAFVEMWIDWNGDGDFNDPGEMVANLDDGTNSFPENVSVAIPSDAVYGQSLGIRIRLSNEDDMTPYGPEISGEVEDYIIEIECGDGPCLNIFSKRE